MKNVQNIYRVYYAEFMYLKLVTTIIVQPKAPKMESIILKIQCTLYKFTVYIFRIYYSNSCVQN